MDFSDPAGLEYSNQRFNGSSEVRERKYLDITQTPYVVERGKGAERIDLGGSINLSEDQQVDDIFTLYNLNGKECKVTFNTTRIPYNSVDRVYVLIFVQCGGDTIVRNAAFVKNATWAIQLVFKEDRTPATPNPTG